MATDVWYTTDLHLIIFILTIGLPLSEDSHMTHKVIIICNLVSCLVRLWLQVGHTHLINESLGLIDEGIEGANEM